MTGRSVRDGNGGRLPFDPGRPLHTMSDRDMRTELDWLDKRWAGPHNPGSLNPWDSLGTVRAFQADMDRKNQLLIALKQLPWQHRHDAAARMLRLAPARYSWDLHTRTVRKAFAAGYPVPADVLAEVGVELPDVTRVTAYPDAEGVL